MRPFSRTMPKYQPTQSMPAIIVVVIIVGCVAFFIWNMPILAVPLAALALFAWCSGAKHKAKLLKMMQQRDGQSICEFARAFDRRSVDPYIIRAVYEGLADYLNLNGASVPIQPEDDLFNDFQMDEDDLDLDLLTEIAFRTGRSLENLDENPFTGKVNTARDLVMFFNGQPLSEAG